MSRAHLVLALLRSALSHVRGHNHGGPRFIGFLMIWAIVAWVCSVYALLYWTEKDTEKMMFNTKSWLATTAPERDHNKGPYRTRISISDETHRVYLRTLKRRGRYDKWTTDGMLVAFQQRERQINTFLLLQLLLLLDGGWSTYFWPNWTHDRLESLQRQCGVCFQQHNWCCQAYISVAVRRYAWVFQQRV